MIRTIIRLVLITAFSLILIFIALFFVRWLGYQQAFAPPPHPWFDLSYWHVYQPPCQGGIEITPPSNTWLLQITVRAVEGEWRLDCSDNVVKLSELLRDSRHPNWILNVKAIDSTYLDSLVAIVAAHDKDKKFAIVSDSQRASRFLRKKAPQWLFAADHASLLRMQMFTSLWIETAMDFWPDFVFASAEVGRPANLSVRLAHELERRHKRIIWTGNEESTPEFPIHGIVTTRPSR